MPAISSDTLTFPPPRRGRKPRAPVQAGELIGRKHIDVIQKYLADLRKLYPHPNRLLYYDDVVTVYLLAFFNPTLRSLRCIEDASELPAINQYLSVESVCRSTLSDANALFDPSHLKGLIEHLRPQLPHLKQADSTLAYLLDQVRVFDGSYFRVAAGVQWALHQTKPDGKPMGQVRLNCQYCLHTGCPEGVSVSGDDGMGEGAAATALVKAGCIYLFDSGVVKFSYLKEILAVDSHFLCSLREHIVFNAGVDRPLNEADRQAGVISDRVGYLESSHAPRGVNAAPGRMLREVRVAYIDRKGCPKELRLLTDLLELPAQVIAELYKYRWQVELFFRWFKVHANFSHLTSHSPNGVMLSFHIALIAMMLTCLHTQAPLSKYGYNLLAMVAAGMGDVADILPILQKRERQRRLERERLARKRAEKKRV